MPADGCSHARTAATRLNGAADVSLRAGLLTILMVVAVVYEAISVAHLRG